MPRLLTSGALGEAMAMAEFGVYNRGLPLVQLVTMLATSLSVLFIPALAEAKFKESPAGLQAKPAWPSAGFG